MTMAGCGAAGEPRSEERKPRHTAREHAAPRARVVHRACGRTVHPGSGAKLRDSSPRYRRQYRRGDSAGPLGALVCQVVALLGTAANLVGLLNNLLGTLTGLLGGLGL